MPRPVSIRPAAVCALALPLPLSSAGVASAKQVSANLRVVGAGAKVLDEATLDHRHDQGADQPEGDLLRRRQTAAAASRPRVNGATALGLLAQAARSTASLRPFEVTDALQLRAGLCTVGGHTATKGSSPGT